MRATITPFRRGQTDHDCLSILTEHGVGEWLIKSIDFILHVQYHDSWLQFEVPNRMHYASSIALYGCWITCIKGAWHVLRATVVTCWTKFFQRRKSHQRKDLNFRSTLDHSRTACHIRLNRLNDAWHGRWTTPQRISSLYSAMIDDFWKYFKACWRELTRCTRLLSPLELVSNAKFFQRLWLSGRLQ